MKVKSEGEVALSCPTLCDPMDCGPPGSSVHGIFQARVLEWLAIVFSEMQMKTIMRYPPYTSQNDHHQKNLQTINSGGDVEKREPSCTVGGNVDC